MGAVAEEKGGRKEKKKGRGGWLMRKGVFGGREVCLRKKECRYGFLLNGSLCFHIVSVMISGITSLYIYIFILMSECEPCGFCHVLVGFELICFHFMLSMAWSSTCFQSSIFVFRLPLPILLCFPPLSFIQLLILPPIRQSRIPSRPCNPCALPS